MVFPSRGCQTCKKRRVGCDSVQPTCGRCTKANRSCVWEPDHPSDGAGSLFRSENAFAQGKPRRPRAPKKTQKEKENAEMAVVPLSQPDSSSVPRTLSIPLQEQAFYYWVENFMFRLDDLPEIGHEYNAHVLFHWVRAKPGSGLHLAFSAISHAVFGKQKKLTKAIDAAEKAHAMSIVKTNHDMKQLSSEESIDQLLITIMLMSSYENTMYGYQQQEPHSNCGLGADNVGTRLWKTFCHHEGAVALLKLRRDYGGKPKLPLDQVIRRQIIRICILRGHLVPDHLVNGSEYGEEGPGLELDCLMVKVAKLRATCLPALHVKQGEDFQPVGQSLEDIALVARNLDHSLSTWSEMLPQAWKFSNEPFPTYPRLMASDLNYGGPLHSYSTHAHASIWNRYRALRIIVNSIWIRTFFSRTSDISSDAESIREVDRCKRTIALLTNDLCAGVLFFFNFPEDKTDDTRMRFIRMGRFTFRTDDEIFPKMGALIAWPLTVAVSTANVPEARRDWLKQRLLTVAKSLADVVLESVVERGEFRF